MHWSRRSVADLIDSGSLELNDGYRVTNKELGPHGIPFVRGGDIGHRGEINTQVEDHVLPAFADRVVGKLTRPWDVAFITKGTVGRVGLLRPGQEACVFAPQVCYWRSLDGSVNARFLFYLLSSTYFQAQLDGVKTHGAMAADYVSLSDQRHFELPIPPLSEQRAIAAVLGALDDKIELNRRMNTTLEALARTIFKSWFVDFDPVRAKAQGRQPVGMDAETAELFPSRFVESELSEIPEGWEVRPLDSMVRLTKGVSYKSADLVDASPTGLVNLKNFKRGGGFRRDGLKPFAGKYKETQAVSPGDVILAQTDVTQAADIIGRVATVPTGLGFHNLVASLDVVIVRTTDGLPPEALFGLLQQERFVDHALARTNGTTVLHLSRDAVPSFQAVIPTREIWGAYVTVAQPLLARVNVAEEESNTLADLRDLLLPKLISGELRIPTAEKLVEDVA